jgi:hypothetical protein
VCVYFPQDSLPLQDLVLALSAMSVRCRPVRLSPSNTTLAAITQLLRQMALYQEHHFLVVVNEALVADIISVVSTQMLLV